MINVIKANGQKEPFSEEKLLHSARRARMPEELEKEFIEHVKQRLHENITTSEIYQHIGEFLDKRQHQHFRARYSLKQAIMDLGPTGYPFEDYVARILQAEGFMTTVRNIIKGKCISHEIDVTAGKNNQKTMVEAKYHNRTGIKTEVHVAMYTKSRFDDIKEANSYTDALLITNTKATTDAISYASCSEMKIISWSYPENEALRDLVEKYGLHPITSLTSISTQEKQTLLQNGLVLCKDICANQHIIDTFNENPERKKQILEEAFSVCNTEEK